MSLYKCKNSVFCAYFLFCFFVGTICGALFFRIIIQQNRAWAGAYCAELYGSGDAGILSLFLCCFRPLATALVLGSFSFGRRITAALIAFRGLSVSYFLSFALCAQCRIFPILVSELMVLAAFFCVCRFLCCGQRSGAVLPVFDWQLILFVLFAAAFISFVQYCLL